MDYFLHLIIMIGVYLPLSYSLNLTLGFGGLLSLSHAAYYGIGAYTYALFLTGINIHPLFALVAAASVTGVSAFMTAIVALRFRGDLFLFVTLGFQMIVFVLLYNWIGLTRGPYGIPGIPRPVFFGFECKTPIHYTCLVMAMNALCLPFLFKLYNSPFGQTLKALRENETAASSLGISPNRIFIQAITISAIVASISGVFYASYVTFIDPTSFTLKESIFIVAMLLLGGSGNRLGPFLGVVIMMLLPEILRFVGLPDAGAHNVREIIYGLAIVLLMYFRPQGVAGEYRIS